MIAVEVLVAILVVTVVLVGIAKIGAPIADAFADRLKLKFQELGPEEERQLKARIAALEDEVRTLKRQVGGIQETVDFSIKIQAEQKAQSGSSSKIEIVPEK